MQGLVCKDPLCERVCHGVWNESRNSAETSLTLFGSVYYVKKTFFWNRLGVSVLQIPQTGQTVVCWNLFARGKVQFAQIAGRRSRADPAEFSKMKWRMWRRWWTKMTREETVAFFSSVFLACVSICSFSSVYWYTWYTWHTFYMFLGVASMWVPCDLHRMRSRRVVKEDCWLPWNCVLLASACNVPLTSWAGELVSWLGTVCYGLLMLVDWALFKKPDRGKWDEHFAGHFATLIWLIFSLSFWLLGRFAASTSIFPLRIMLCRCPAMPSILGLFASFVNEPARKPPRQLVQS